MDIRTRYGVHKKFLQVKSDQTFKITKDEKNWVEFQSGNYMFNVSGWDLCRIEADEVAVLTVQQTDIDISQVMSLDGQAVEVVNFPTDFEISNFPTEIGVNNFPAVQSVSVDSNKSKIYVLTGSEAESQIYNDLGVGTYECLLICEGFAVFTLIHVVSVSVSYIYSGSTKSTMGSSSGLFTGIVFGN